MSVSVFRALLLSSVIVGIVGGAIDLVLPSLLTEGFRQAQETHDAAVYASRGMLLGGLGIAILVLTIVAVYGLYTFRRWALRAAAVSTALGLLLVVLAGVYAQSGVAVAMSYFASYLWGAVLLAAAIQPLSSRFQRG